MPSPLREVFQSLSGNLRFCGTPAATAIPCSACTFQSLSGNLRFCGWRWASSSRCGTMFQSLSGNLRFCGTVVDFAVVFQDGVSIPFRESALLRRSVAEGIADESGVSIPFRESALLRHTREEADRDRGVVT